MTSPDPRRAVLDLVFPTMYEELVRETADFAMEKMSTEVVRQSG